MLSADRSVPITIIVPLFMTITSYAVVAVGLGSMAFAYLGLLGRWLERHASPELQFLRYLLRRRRETDTEWRQRRVDTATRRTLPVALAGGVLTFAVAFGVLLDARPWG